MNARRFLLLLLVGVGLAFLPAVCRLDARSDVGDGRRRSAVGGGLRGRLGSGLRGDASHLRRGRRRLAGNVLAPGRQLRVQGRAQRLLGRELRPPRRVLNGANIPLNLGAATQRQVLLRPQDPLGHRQPQHADPGRGRELPVRARLSGRLAARLPALVARGPGRQRHCDLRDDRAPGRVVRREGRRQRELGRELRRGRRAGRRQHPVLGSVRPREGHVQLRHDLARPDDLGRRSRRARRARSRTSTSRARTASARRATRRRRSGTRSRTAS